MARNMLGLPSPTPHGQYEQPGCEQPGYRRPLTLQAASPAHEALRLSARAWPAIGAPQPARAGGAVGAGGGRAAGAGAGGGGRFAPLLPAFLLVHGTRDITVG